MANMTHLTLKSGVLQVASAFPDPPFEDDTDGKDTGFDSDLMQLICDNLGLAWQPVKYTGDDSNGIFDGLTDGSYEAVISGTTITPKREQVALFSVPYREFNQVAEASRMHHHHNDIGHFQSRTQAPKDVMDTRGVPVSVKSVSRAVVATLALFPLIAICCTFPSEPPRTRTWNLEIKSLFR